VGARGIKRRKPKRELRDLSANLSSDDERRVFGRFQWSTSSPAGAFERGEFFVRHLGRNGSDHAGRKSLRLLCLTLPMLALVGAALVLVAVVLNLVH
jgi:hypothetical protein